MPAENPKELAESTKRYVTQFLTNLDKHIIELGPDEALTEFLCQYMVRIYNERYNSHWCI